MHEHGKIKAINDYPGECFVFLLEDDSFDELTAVVYVRHKN